MEWMTEPNQYEECLRDESRLRGHAQGAAFPTDTLQLAALMRDAAQAGDAVTLQGSRTGIVGGAVPMGGWILSTRQMDRILGVSCRGGVYRLRVQAGVTLAQVHQFLLRPKALPDWGTESVDCCRQLRATPHCFGPNPTESTATLGGLFATDAKGANSLVLGGVARHVDALAWVTPRGDVWRLERGEYLFDDTGCLLPDGTRLDCPTALPAGAAGLLHPAPGLDLIDLLGGSEGLAGCAAELELRLTPVPPECWAVVFFFPGQEMADAFTRALMQWRTGPEGALLWEAEYYDHPVLELLRREKDHVSALKSLSDFPAGAQAAIQVVLEGEDPDALEGALMALMELFEAAGGREEDTWAAASREEAALFQTLRHAVPEVINTMVDQRRLTYPDCVKTAGDLAGPPELALAYLDRYHGDLAASGLTGYVFGHLLENRLHVNLLPGDTQEHREARQLLARWAGQTVADGGLAAGENGVGRAKRQLVLPLLEPDRKAQLLGILARLDPDGILRRDWEAEL